MSRPSRYGTKISDQVRRNSGKYKFLTFAYFVYIVGSLFYIVDTTTNTFGTTFSNSGEPGTRRILSVIQKRILGQVDIDVQPPFTDTECKGGDTVEGSIACGSNAECVAFNETLNICKCDKCYSNDPSSLELCSVKHLPALALLLITIFVGFCGVDHCVASGCSCPGVCFGILKALTAGGLGIWYICDIVFAGTGTWNDRYPGSKTICEW